MYQFIKSLTIQKVQALISLAREQRMDDEKTVHSVPVQSTLALSYAQRMQQKQNKLYAQLVGKINSLSKNGKNELMALAWVGQQKARVNPVVWADLVAAAATEPALSEVNYLTGLEFLDVYWENGLARVG